MTMSYRPLPEVTTDVWGPVTGIDISKILFRPNPDNPDSQ